MTPAPQSRIAPPCCPCNRHTTCEECCAAFERTTSAEKVLDDLEKAINDLHYAWVSVDSLKRKITRTRSQQQGEREP